MTSWSDLRPGQMFVTKCYVWYIIGVRKYGTDMIEMMYLNIDREDPKRFDFGSLHSYDSQVAFEEDPV